MAEHAKSKPALNPKLATVHWEGNSLDVLKTWNAEIRVDFGNALREMQEGRAATLDVRPMPSIGKGVFELKTADEKKWYRLMYLARIADGIYVLDCFEKDTRRTEKKDLARTSSRLTQVKQRFAEEQRNAKRKERSEQANPRH